MTNLFSLLLFFIIITNLARSITHTYTHAHRDNPDLTTNLIFVKILPNNTRDVTKYLQLLMKRQGYNFDTSSEFEIVREIKEKVSFALLSLNITTIIFNCAKSINFKVMVTVIVMILAMVRVMAWD